MVDGTQFCTFRVDNLFMGVEVRHVQEVLRHQELTRVPLAPPDISGLINLRGQILTTVDLRRRLQLSPRGPEARPMNVILQLEHETISLLVDEIGDVLTVDAQIFEEPPDTLTGPARELIRGVYKLKDKLLLVLLTERVLAPLVEAAA